MQISLIRAKLHHARVTDADINYEGSIGIDTRLIEAAGLFAYERVLVANVENGERLETYIIPVENRTTSDPLVVTLNGAAAHRATVGDRLIVMAFAYVDVPPFPAYWEPRVVLLDEYNKVTRATGDFMV